VPPDAIDYALDIREGRTTLAETPKKLRPEITLRLKQEGKLIERAKDRAAARQVPPSARMTRVGMLR
jgi:hypothetical protein